MTVSLPSARGFTVPRTVGLKNEAAKLCSGDRSFEISLEVQLD